MCRWVAARRPDGASGGGQRWGSGGWGGIHEPVDVTQWLLYVNPSIWAGHGLGQGEGPVFTQDGKLVASYTGQAMIRGFKQPPDARGKDWSNAM